MTRLLQMKLGMFSSLALGLNETSSLASTHARNTLQALGAIHDPSNGATLKLIGTIIVIGAYWLLSNHYKIYSLVFLHMTENAWNQRRTGSDLRPTHLVRRLGEAWMHATGYASRASSQRIYSHTQQKRMDI
jgi:hypothetical protein